jgi:hypothetical protein
MHGARWEAACASVHVRSHVSPGISKCLSQLETIAFYP